MDEDKDIVGQLGGFALEQFLGSFTGEQGISSNSLSAVGLGDPSGSGSTSRGANAAAAGLRVDASQIYSGRYEDDEEEDGEDWEDEVDREMDAEDNQSKQLMLQLPPAPSRPAVQTLMRGEDEDFDDDDEDVQDEHDGKDEQRASQDEHAGNADAGPSSTPASAFRMPDASEIMHIKQEEQDLDGVLHPHSRRENDERGALIEAEDEEEQIDPQELAAQQALFAQSYARMQAQQQPFEDGTSAQRAPSPPLADVKTLYPSFAPDKVLNFTEIFHPRPRKRVRIDPNIQVCE